MSGCGNIFLSFSSSLRLETGFKATGFLTFDLLTYKRGTGQPKILPLCSSIQEQAKWKWWESILPQVIPVEHSPIGQVEKSKQQWTKLLGSRALHFIVMLSQATDQAGITMNRPDKRYNLHTILRGDRQAMELFVGHWEQEAVNRMPGTAIDRRTMALWQGKLCAGRPTDTDQKRFSTALCRKTLSSVTFRYFQPHFCTGINHSVNSIVLDYKGQPWRISGPSESADSVVNFCECQRVFFFVVSRAAWVIYACRDLY